MIFRYFVMVLIFSTVFLFGIAQNTYAVFVVAVTDSGSSFPIMLESSLYGNNTGNGTSIFDGLGAYLGIQNINTNGKTYFGNGDNPGKQTDIRQYVGIGNSDDWVIAITDDDIHEILYVPELGKDYNYVSGTLVNASESDPNILGYSTSKSMSGTNSISIGNDGITISGTGVAVADISMMNGTSVLLTGIIDTGANLEIIQTIQDVIGVTSYSAVKGYLISQMNAALSGSNAYANTNIELHTLDILTAETWQTSPHQHSELYQCGRGKCYRYWNHDHVSNIGTPTFTDTIDVEGNRLITRIEKSGIDVNSTYEFKIYVTDFGEKLQIFNSDFESVHEFVTTAKNIYLIAEIDSNSVLIKGEIFDPDVDVFFQVDGLLPDIAYDVSESGITGVVGKTSSTGEISLLHNDVDFGISTSPGGILKIYPDSAKYLGNFGIGMIDLYNGCSVPLLTGDNLAYMPQNFVRWVFPVSVEVENVQVDTISLNCLNGNYTKNDALLIPVIPVANTIYATINNEDVEILMRDVATTTQIKQVPQKTSTSSDHNTSGAASTTSNISTSTFLTATHTGIMSVNLDLKIGGSADFSMDASYTGGFTASTSCGWSGASSPYRSYSCRDYSTPSNPSGISNLNSLTIAHQSQLTTALNNGQVSQITVEVDIFKNLQYVETILIYKSNSAQASITSTLSEANYSASNQVHITYPLTSISENITIAVDVGDMMEYIVRVNLEASGVPAPSSVDGSYSSYVKTTTEFGGGVITVGMS